MRLLRSRKFQVLLFAVAASTLVGGVGLTARIERDWSLAREEGRALERRIDSELLRERPALFGEAIEGSAWSDYQRACDALPEDSVERWLAHRSMEEEGREHEQARDELLREHAESLEALLLGAGHTNGRYPVRWEDGFRNQAPSLMQTRALVNVAVVGARAHAEAGHPELAADLLLASLQLACDLRSGPFLISGMIGTALTQIAVRGLVDSPGPGALSLLELLPTEELERLADGLRGLDENQPSERLAFEAELALLVREMERARSGGEIALNRDFARLVSWRYSWSATRMLADHVSAGIDWSERHRASEARPWSERRELLREEAREAEQSENLLRQSTARFCEKAMGGLLIGELWLRFGRMAVAARLGRLEPLPDPFGGHFEVGREEDGLTIRSQGPEGAGAAYYTLVLDADQVAESGRSGFRD